MPQWLNAVFEWLTGIPEGFFLVILGLAAGLENVVPPIPADVVVLGGSLLAVRAEINLGLVFLVVWLGNAGGALLVYLVGRRHGAAFFDGRIGASLLKPRQLAQLEVVYRRFGFPVIFLSRFLPMFRAVVPAFAGVARVGFLRTAVPIATASAIWYGGLVYLGGTAGRNWSSILRGLETAGQWLWLFAALVGATLAWWWLRSR